MKNMEMYGTPSKQQNKVVSLNLVVHGFLNGFLTISLERLEDVLNNEIYLLTVARKILKFILHWCFSLSKTNKLHLSVWLSL